VRKLNKVVVKQRDELKKCREMAEAANLRASETEKMNENLQRTLRDTDEEAKMSQRLQQELQTKVRSLTYDVDKLQEENATLRTEVAQATSLSDPTTPGSVSVTATAGVVDEDVIRELTSLRAEVSSLATHRDALQNKLKEVSEAKATSSQADPEIVTQLMERLRTTTEKLKKQEESLPKSVAPAPSDDFAAELEALAEGEEGEKEPGGAELVAQQNEAVIAAAVAAASAHRRQASDADVALSVVQVEAETLRAEVESARATIQRLEGELRESSAVSEHRLERMNKQITRTDGMEVTLRHNEQRIAELELQLQEKRATDASSRASVEVLQRKETSMLQQVNELKQEMANAAQRADARRTRLETQVETLTLELRQANETAELAVQTCQREKAAAQAIRGEFDSLRSQLSEAQAAATRAAAAVEASNEERQQQFAMDKRIIKNLQLEFRTKVSSLEHQLATAMAGKREEKAREEERDHGEWEVVSEQEAPDDGHTESIASLGDHSDDPPSHELHPPTDDLQAMRQLADTAVSACLGAIERVIESVAALCDNPADLDARLLRLQSQLQTSGLAPDSLQRKLTQLTGLTDIVATMLEERALDAELFGARDNAAVGVDMSVGGLALTMLRRCWCPPALAWLVPRQNRPATYVPLGTWDHEEEDD